MRDLGVTFPHVPTEMGHGVKSILTLDGQLVQTRAGTPDRPQTDLAERGTEPVQLSPIKFIFAAQGAFTG